MFISIRKLILRWMAMGDRQPHVVTYYPFCDIDKGHHCPSPGLSLVLLPKGVLHSSPPVDGLSGHAQNSNCPYSTSFKKEESIGPPLFKSRPSATLHLCDLRQGIQTKALVSSSGKWD